MNDKLITIVALAVPCIVLSSFGGFGPIGEGTRKENKDGDVLVSYEREGKGRYFPGVELAVRDSQDQLQQLTITNCLQFVDAKLDKKSKKLAVVFNDGLHLVYHLYANTDGSWRLSRAVVLVEYGIDFTIYGNRLELQDFNTLRASFIKKGESFSKTGRQRGVEQAGDKVYLFRITDDGNVTINGQERRSRQWRPDN